MSADMAPVIAATTRWLLGAYPAADGALSTALAEAQARQAVTVAAFLRYPTVADAALLVIAGPGGSARIDQLCPVRALIDYADERHAWRTWVDEVLVSWAACLLSDPGLARRAVEAVANSEHVAGLRREFRCLIAPDDTEWHAATLLRHPDLLAPVAHLHRDELLRRLEVGAVDAA